MLSLSMSAMYVTPPLKIRFILDESHKFDYPIIACYYILIFECVIAKGY